MTDAAALVLLTTRVLDFTLAMIEANHKAKDDLTALNDTLRRYALEGIMPSNAELRAMADRIDAKMAAIEEKITRPT